QLNLEYQRRVGWNLGWPSCLTVSFLCRNGELAFAARLHAHDPLIPAFDDRSGAELELERLTPIERAVELGAIQQCSCVMHLDGITGFCGSAIALLDVFLDQGCHFFGRITGRGAGARRWLGLRSLNLG